MVELKRTIGKPEEQYYYLNLTDNDGNSYGSRFPPAGTPLWVVTSERRYKASKRGGSQIWGVLRSWYEKEDVHRGDTVRIRYDPTAAEIDGRVPIEISIENRSEHLGNQQPLGVAAEDEQRETDEVEAIRAEVTVQIERDLEDFLVENLDLVEKGLELYSDDQGRAGRQYPTDVGNIDMLCRDKDEFVVVELKKGRTTDVVVGQVSRYIGWVRENLSEGKNVRGVIIVHDFDPRLKYAVLAHDNLQLKYYEIQIRFISEQEATDRMLREP